MKKNLKGFFITIGIILFSVAVFLLGFSFIISRSDTTVQSQAKSLSTTILSEESYVKTSRVGARQLQVSISEISNRNEEFKIADTFKISNINCEIRIPTNGYLQTPNENQVSAKDAATTFINAYKKLLPNEEVPDLSMVFFNTNDFTYWIITPTIPVVKIDPLINRVNATNGILEGFVFPIIDSDYFVKEKNKIADYWIHKTNPTPFLNLADLDTILNEKNCITLAQKYIEQYELLEKNTQLSNPSFELIASNGIKTIHFDTNLDYPNEITVYMDLKSGAFVGYDFNIVYKDGTIP